MYHDRERTVSYGIGKLSRVHMLHDFGISLKKQGFALIMLFLAFKLVGVFGLNTLQLNDSIPFILIIFKV